MIVTLTPNPSVDRTLELPGLTRGAVLRATGVRIDAGGKGINVSRALRANGHATRAVLPSGGREGEQLEDALAELGIPVDAVRIAQPIRSNVSLVEPDGTVTKVNAPGPCLTLDELQALTARAVDSLTDADWVAACGSLPPGAPDDLLADLVVAAHRVGATVAVDTSGPPLLAALAVGPDLIKPNVEELGAAVGRHLAHLGDVIDAANEVRDRGARTVVVSLGPDGAVLVDDTGAWHATTPPVTPRSNVGAGDSLVAGLLAGGGRGPEALATGVAYGTAAVQLPGTSVPGPDDLDLTAVRVAEVDPDHPLTESGGPR